MNNFESDPQIYKEAFESEGQMKKSYYIQKGDLKIKLGTYSLDNESKILQLEGLFKTFLSRLLLNEDKQIQFILHFLLIKKLKNFIFSKFIKSFALKIFMQNYKFWKIQMKIKKK